MLKNILNKSETIEGIGEVYPIQIKDYYDFEQVSHYLFLSKECFENVEGEDLKLLDLLMYTLRKKDLYDSDAEVSESEKEENFNANIIKLEKLFSLVLKREVYFYTDSMGYCFYIDGLNYLRSLSSIAFSGQIS